MPRVSQDHLDARRRQILAGARQCFAEYGYEGATVRRLETATGLSRGAIFHHFHDKETLFFALAEEDAHYMADVIAADGLVQVMRNIVRETDELSAAWLGTRLEISRRLRTDPLFRKKWSQHAEKLSAATTQRLRRQQDIGALRDDISIEVLVGFLELFLEGLVSHIAMGLPKNQLEAILDFVEEAVRPRD